MCVYTLTHRKPNAEGGHMPWNKETAREAGRKGGLTRAANAERRRNMAPADRAKALIGDNIEAIVRKAIDAALKQGDFQKIDVSDQKDAIKTCMAYGLGRPPSANPSPGRTPGPTPEAPQEGLTFGLDSDE